jgi:hypothetical protein
MEQWWKVTDRGKPNYLKKNLCQCHFVHKKFDMHWPGVYPVPLQCEADN